MFKSFGLPELLLVLAIVVLLFGVGRIGKIAKELGGGIRSFKDGLQGKDENKAEDKEEEKENKEE
ncbi:MAG: twin-arginine translocase TatA/TatE family subunit [Chloroflexi bacterium]|nr:twin-arginine translocase TatA/TatE family subunit [Chloroflexota bacterium]